MELPDKTDNNRLIKVCLKCSDNYVSDATQRNRKGMCKKCIRSGYRERYAITITNNGGEVHSFNKMLSAGYKFCTICKCKKEVSEFSKRGEGKIRASCKVCDSISYKKYEKENKHIINQNRRERRKNPVYGIIFTQRDRQRSLFKNKNVYKPSPSTKIIRQLLGCEVEQCKKHIESLFTSGMNWDNKGIGKDKWQIDHKIPVSLTVLDADGNMTDCELNKQIWHYTNLQPLWHIENAKKSNKLNYGYTITN